MAVTAQTKSHICIPKVAAHKRDKFKKNGGGHAFKNLRGTKVGQYMQPLPPSEIRRSSESRDRKSTMRIEMSASKHEA